MIYGRWIQSSKHLVGVHYSYNVKYFHDCSAIYIIQFTSLQLEELKYLTYLYLCVGMREFFQIFSEPFKLGILNKRKPNLVTPNKQNNGLIICYDKYNLS